MDGTDQQALLSRIRIFLRNQNGLSLSMLGVILLLTIYLIFGSKPWDPELDFGTTASSSLRTHSFVIEGLWWGALVNLFLISTSLFLSRYYPRSSEKTDSEYDARKNLKSTPWKSLTAYQRRIILSLSLLAVATSVYLNAPQLNHSLWGDEEATARRFIVGHVNRQDDGSMRLHEPSWEKTLWNFDFGPNNHILFSVLSKLSHSFATLGNGPDDYYFSEFWIRLPSFLTGLGAVAAIAWLMIVMGFPRTAPLASITLALHPWFVRWGTEARGYSLQLFLVLIILVFLLKALGTKQNGNSWKWWTAYGITEFFLIWSHLGSVYFLFPLNVAALVLVWKQSTAHGLPRNPFRQPLVWQVVAANLLGAGLTIQLMAPCLKPLRIWLERYRIEGDVTWQWIEDWFSYFASGMPWTAWDETNPNCFTLPQYLDDHPFLGYFFLLLIAIGLSAGVAALLRNRQWCWLLLPLLTPGLLTVIHAKLGGTLLYPWYTVGFLPLSIVVFSIGIDHSSRLIPKRSSFIIIAILFTLTFGLVTQPQRQIYRSQPVEALAESVKLTRKVINPFHPGIDDVITLDVVHATRLYDPAHLRIRSLKAFVDALKLADTSSRPLYLNLGNPGLLSRDLPGIGQLIDNRDIFTSPTLIHGLQNPCTRYISQYIPNSIQNISLPNPSEKE